MAGESGEGTRWQPQFIICTKGELLSELEVVGVLANSVSFGVFSHSKGLGAKWHVCLLGFFAAIGFRLPKGSLECSPNSSLHWSHSLLRFFGQMAVASERVLWRVLPTFLYICLPNGCCFIKILWRVPPAVLYIYLPVFCCGESCVNCWHVSPIQIQSAENDPSCRCCWGILWAYLLPHNKTEGVGTSVLLDNMEIDTLESVGPHSRNVVHRDVKGDNYLMDRKDNFGIDFRVCREVETCLKCMKLFMDWWVCFLLVVLVFGFLGMLRYLLNFHAVRYSSGNKILMW